jgi:leucyl-tRNA synthetase
MSKSKGTGVAPGTIANRFGIDTMRAAMMFGAPPEIDLNFDEKMLQDMKSFLDRVQRLNENVCKVVGNEGSEDKEGFRHVLTLIKDYDVKISSQRFFHVAIARLMELTNLIQKHL